MAVTTLWLMMADPDLVAAVSARVVWSEMARRIPDWDGRPVTVPPGLPPLTTLADRAYPRAVLERRLRFLRLMEWYPGEATLPPEAGIEDRLAIIWASAAPPDPDADPGATSLIWALRAPGTVRPGGREGMAALAAFFDGQADTIDPGWRDRWPRHPLAASAWARAEAAALPADRFFGRMRAGAGWDALSDLVWRLAELKRRRWG